MTTKILLLLASALILSACGNKGPLVMPQKPVPVETERLAPSAPTTLPQVTPETAPKTTSETAPEATSPPTDPASNSAPK